MGRIQYWLAPGQVPLVLGESFSFHSGSVDQHSLTTCWIRCSELGTVIRTQLPSWSFCFYPRYTAGRALEQRFPGWDPRPSSSSIFQEELEAVKSSL